MAPRVLLPLLRYRVGYSPERPYPWRWTTPAALGLLALAICLLTCINIPLAGYETVAQPTFFPNETLATLPFSGLIPAFMGLQDSHYSVTPQTMSVGDTIRLNNSEFDLVLRSAFDASTGHAIQSFSYLNVPFSECDVRHITIRGRYDSNGYSLYDGPIIEPSPKIEILAGIECSLPSRVYFETTTGNDTWPVPEFKAALVGALADTFRSNSSEMSTGYVQLTACPCCDCPPPFYWDWEIGSVTFDQECKQRLPLTSGCNARPAVLTSTWWLHANTSTQEFWRVSQFNSHSGFLPGDLGGAGNASVLNDAFSNMFHVYYHVLRRDLGAIVPTNIIVAPEWFNHSIRSGPSADEIRGLTGSTTALSDWQERNRPFTETTRAPVMQYQRLMPQRKPLGSAITSVFTATFAMVATLWASFHFVARLLVLSDEPKAAEEMALPAYQWGASNPAVLRDVDGEKDVEDLESLRRDVEELKLAQQKQEDVHRRELEHVLALLREATPRGGAEPETLGAGEEKEAP